LGKGGMGSVYRAKHKFLRSLHAVKIISPEVVRSDETLLVRFRQEAILAASIHHPNVVAVTDFGVTKEDTPFLVMEYIEGVSLDDFLRKEKRLSPSKAFEILAPMALGVGQAHSKGITHRDLKPLNVMLRSGYPLSQAVKVLDFGLAKIKSTESFASFIQAKTTNILGSPHYMSPEQWENEGVDTRSDIYSLGIILFQMLTGEVPFKGGSIPTIMYQHLQLPTPTFDSLGIPAEPQIEAVIQKALAKEQNQRFATVEEFLYAYEKALYNSGNQVKDISNAKTLSFYEDDTVSEKPPVTGETKQDTDKNFSRTYNLTYLNSAQNETLADYFNHPKQLETNENEKLEREFIHAQNRVEAARTQISEADKLALEFNEAQKAAEEARNKFVEAQQKLEEDVRRRMQAEMESKLAAERQAREKAEAEASRLIEEVNSRKAAEERANLLARTALEAQHRAEEERQKAEKEARQRQLEEGTRRKAEEAALKLAEQVAEAKKKYEEAKKEAEYEAYYRLEAEVKRKKVEEEIRQIAEDEAEKRKLAEAQAAYQIKEQASRLEKQALEAEEKANEARQLAESEAAKREWAEMARIKAEEEARRLAEEIIEAQKRLEEAQQLARYESEKRALEEAARKKAEESARSSSIENQQNVESIKKNLMSQIEAAEQRARSESEKRIIEEEARKKAEESARSLSASQDNAEKLNRNFQNSVSNAKEFKDSSPNISADTPSGFDVTISRQKFTNTASTAISNTNQIPVRKGNNLVFLVAGILAFFIISGVGGLFIYYKFSPVAVPDKDFSGNSSPVNTSTQTPSPELSARIKNKMVFVKGGSFSMGRNEADPKDDPIYGSQYPAHSVTVEDFYLDRTEVTNEEYAEFVKATKYKAPDNWLSGKIPAGQEQFPVTRVSNLDARNFADWISSRDKVPCRLPTEQEWEYAARSGAEQNIYPWGNEWTPSRVNFATGTVKEVGASSDETVVGGIKDMMGNVLEWTSSIPEYYPNFPESLKKDVAGRITVRGVSYTKSKAETLKKTDLLLTLRQGVSPDKKFDFLGFRIVCNAK
jgi:serine/threonine protein kinase/formylglycine-generating enzyme required for sulfatase activity